jgi:uncharacterized membrane protein YraQ (UPF0718 family)
MARSCVFCLTAFSHHDSVRLIHFYLAVYFLLVAGAVLSLWQAQVLQRMPGEWVGLSVLVAISLGVLLAFLSHRPAPVAE